MTQAPYSKIIENVAKEMLAPLGLEQKGHSRLWLDDQGWWVILVELQPSGFSKGTYLNVGVNWLWYKMNYFSFDYGYRSGTFNETRHELRLKDWDKGQFWGR